MKTVLAGRRSVSEQYRNSKEERKMIVRKCFLAALTALCMALVLLPGTALAVMVDSGNCSRSSDDNVAWTVDDAGILTISGMGAMTNYASIYTNPMVSRHKSSIREIIIDTGVTHIGKLAFTTLTNVSSVTISDGLTSIGISAFMSCSSLTSITIPNSVTSIEIAAFSNCRSLTNVAIFGNVDKIREKTFDSCSSLTSIAIPDSVTSIEQFAFSACNKLSDVYYSGTKAQWQAISIDESWQGNEPLHAATIHCSDGDLINGEPAEPDNGQLHGKITVSGTYNAEGETVTLYITPDPGYKVSYLTVTDNDGNRRVLVTHTGHSGNMNTYTFNMPSYDVKVNVKFAKL